MPPTSRRDGSSKQTVESWSNVSRSRPSTVAPRACDFGSVFGRDRSPTDAPRREFTTGGNPSMLSARRSRLRRQMGNRRSEDQETFSRRMNKRKRSSWPPSMRPPFVKPRPFTSDSDTLPPERAPHLQGARGGVPQSIRPARTLRNRSPRASVSRLPHPVPRWRSVDSDHAV